MYSYPSSFIIKYKDGDIMKYKVLIADDELWIRKWLTKMIGELRTDIEIVAAVDNGKDALDILQKEHVDILVTDIQMPLMTGLEVAEMAQDVKIILISGYDEFAYAKKAIKLQVMGYLLKPIEKSELDEVLETTIETIKNTGKSNADAMTVDNALQNLLSAYIKSRQEKTLLEIIGVTSGLGIQAMVVGEIQLDIAQHNRVMLQQYFEESILPLYLQQHVYLIAESALRYKVIIFFHHQLTKDIFLMKQFLIDRIERMYIQSRVVLSQMYTRVEKLSDALEKVEQAMQKTHVVNAKDGQVIEAFNKDVMYAIRSSMLLAMNSFDDNTFIDYCRQLSFRLENNEYALDEIRMFIFGLVSDVIKKIEETDGELRNILISEGYDFCVKIQKYSNVFSMVSWVEKFGVKVIKYLQSNQYSNVTDLVDRARKHLLIHYAEEISLSAMCDKFGVNRSYFSKCFKEKAGMNFSDMLTNIRLDAATQLISSTKMSLVDISENVGFNDPKYFSRVFRKYYGMTPSQYREKH